MQSIKEKESEFGVCRVITFALSCLIVALSMGQAIAQEEEVVGAEVEYYEGIIEVPERYQKLWPAVSWFYEGILDGDETEKEMASILPDSMKHPVISPVFATLSIVSFFVGSIWLLVAQFQVSLGWGFGQLGANLANCLLIVPGLIVAIVFLCLHWDKGKVPFMIAISSIGLMMIALFMVPSWAVPSWE